MNVYNDGTHSGGGGRGTSIGMYGDTGLTTEAGSDSEAGLHKERLAERRVLFMGLPRSGKTSIIKVVLEDEMAYDTLALLPTRQRTEYRMLAGITVYDFPGIDDYSDAQYYIDPDVYVGENTVVAYVIDSQSDIQSSISTLLSVIRQAQAVNYEITINVLINKIDGLSDELKQDIQHDIQQRVLKMISYENFNPNHINFALTTIYNESIREAFSRVIQYLVPQHSTLEAILNSFCSKSSLEKVFLFDIHTKIYIATDLSPTSSQRYHFACKTIDVLDEMTILCGPYASVNDEDKLLQRINVTLEGYDSVFIFQVTPNLVLFCSGSPQVIRQTSLLDFNASKVAKAIRKILH
ncbi:hypothetical protein H4R19_003805 [Coemansia spiralis]|nr:hypothetical protein H4R19_003805 [Coemansia spiralis]